MRNMLLLSVSALLAGCAVGPEYHRADMALSSGFHAGAISAEDGRDWWSHFNDPLLDKLVAQALAQNLDVAAAAARIAQARAAVTRANADLLPSVSATGSAQRDRTSADTPNGAVADRLMFPLSYSLYQIGAEAAWEVDLFGELGRRQEGARAQAAAVVADANAVRLSVAAETADTYLQLRGLQSRLAVAEQQLANEKQLSRLIEERVAQGLTPPRELNRVSGEVQELDANLPPLRAAISAQINRLSALTGRQAGPMYEDLQLPGDIPLAPDPAGDADPAALMRRRPDLVAAERRVAASNARIGEAMGEYYPHFSLGGLLSTATLSTGNLFADRTTQGTGFAGLRWRLFDFGRVDAEVAQAKGKNAEALAQYRGAVLHATEEVENALSQLAEGRMEIAAREREISALSQARDQARQAYSGGVIALVEVLDADRALLNASDRLATARAAAARASVAAVRALGGGFGTPSHVNGVQS
ncbi:TolC family protein [Sphingobium sp. BHU LFT2]|uniref:efflux transporter outer membrane subunit n=1 Tax=Sphingobium sp. BHU LFT2 TaxID=2807634 RepID=UPI001BE7ECEE|nr:TolC family protein [Sphingobium sp. BHU LFT2]MBT2246285.1 TolC family protein [Sphingobium sp. BHU LFT2]